MTVRPMLAVIPARGGSKGVPRKNLHEFAGLPLIAHSIRFVSLVPAIDRCVISTDDDEIATVARAHGGDVPYTRPASLAQDDTAMWPVLQDAMRRMEEIDGTRYESLLLLDPTSPGRLPEDVERAMAMLGDDPNAVGVIAVSEPSFNPRWVCVEEVGGYLRHLVPQGPQAVRRQDIPPTYRINALLYLWRRDHLMSSTDPGYDTSPHRLLVVPEIRASHIDSLDDLKLAEFVVREGIVQFPWLRVDHGR